MIRYRMSHAELAIDQEYRLLLRPVLMPRISTGCNNSQYFWPGYLARFLVVDVLFRYSSKAETG